MKIDFTIVIICYNSGVYITACLSSIFNQSTRIKYEVIVVDNSSTDSTIKIIEANFKEVTLIKSDVNLGYAAGNNKGALVSNSENILFLNPDTKLNEGDIDAMYEKISKTSRTLLTPLQINYESGEFLNCGLGLDIFGFPINELGAKKFFYADGAALLLKKRDFINLGMFDEDLFLIQDDIDLCWKARLMGYKIEQVSDIKIFHKSGHVIGGGGDSTKIFSTNVFRRYYGERNSIRNVLKNYSVCSLLWVLPSIFFINLSEIFLFLILLKPQISLMYIKAYYSNLRELSVIRKKRRWIQKRRVIKDSEIFKYMYIGSAKLKLLINTGIPVIK